MSCWKVKYVTNYLKQAILKHMHWIMENHILRVERQDKLNVYLWRIHFDMWQN